MRAKAVAWLVAAASVIGLLTYGLIAHKFSIVDDRSAGSYTFAIASIFGVLACTAAFNRAWKSLALIIAAGVLFGWWFSQHAQLSTTWIYLIQHAGAHASLAVLFGSSLLPGRLPLVTRMASLLHPEPDADRNRYTRQVTWAWTIYLATIALTSVTLFLAGWTVAWSWLANVLTLPLLALMFVIEFIVRKYRLPNEAPGRLSDGWKAYQQMRAQDSQTSQSG